MEKTVCFSNQVEMPSVGLGLYKVSAEEMLPAVQSSYDIGYRHFDTAQMYENEDFFGTALKRLAIPRDSIFVTTKIHNTNQGYEQTLASFRQSCRDLQLDYVDQLLIHWPGQDPRRTAETWRAFEKLYDEKLVRVIGLSNFTLRHIKIIEQTGNIRPMSNQIERNPKNNQNDFLPELRRRQIVPIAWSPMVRGSLEFPQLSEIGKKYGKSVAQVALRWSLQSGLAILPKSVRASRQAENFDLFDFELTPEDMQIIDQQHTGERTSFDPETFDF